MSDSNVKIAEQLVSAWNRADWGFSGSFYRPDAEVVGPEGWPEADDAKGWPATFPDGKVSRQELYLDRGQAMRAAGLAQ